MATDNTIKIDIQAVNNASPVLTQIQKDVTATTTAVQMSSKEMANLAKEANYLSDAADSSRGLGRHFTALASTVGGQLNPALAQSGAFMSIVAREGERVSLGMTAFAVSAAVVVGAMVEFNKVVTESAARHVELARVLASSDFPGASAQLQKAVVGLRTQIELLNAEPLRKFFADISQFLSGIGIKSGGFIESIFGTATQEKALREAQQTFQQVFPEETRQRILAATQEIGAAFETMGQLTLRAALETLNINAADIARAQVLDNLKLKQDAATESLQRKQEAEKGALSFNFPGGVPANIASELESAQAAEQRALSEKQIAESKAVIKGLDDTARAIELERLQTIREIVKLQGQYVDLSDPSLIQRFTEAGLQGLDQEIARLQSKGSILRQNLLLTQATAVENARQSTRLGEQGAITIAELQLQGIGATGPEAAALKIAIQQARTQTAISQANLIQNPTDRQLQIEKLQAENAAAVAQTRFEQASKDNPLLGLQQGFKSIVDEWTAAGAMLKDLTRTIGATMADSMSETFFDVVTGQFSKLSDVSRQFGLSLLKNLTDTLSKAVVGNTFQNLLGGLGLSGGTSFVRGLGVLGGGLTAGGLVEVGGQLFQSAATAGGETVLVPTGSAGATVLAGAGAATTVGGVTAGGGGSLTSFLSLFQDTGSAIRAFLNTPLSAVGASLFSSDVVFSGGQLISNAGELAAQGIESAGVAGSSSILGSSATIGSALGAVGAVAGLAFSIYSGLTGPPTAQNIASGAVSGALSGAMLGTLIYPGVGTVIGAVAGGLLGGGAAALGKGGTGQTHAQRQQAEANRATSAASAVQGQVGATTSLQELYDLLTANNTGYVGGTSAVAIVSMIRVPGKGDSAGYLFIGRPNPTYPVATLDEFAQWGPTTYIADLQAGVDASLLTGSNQSMTQAVRQKIAELVKAEASLKLSTIDVLASPFGGNVARTSYFSGDRAGEFAGQQFNVEGLSLAGMTDAEAAALLQRFAKLDQDLNLNILFRDPTTDDIVSMSTTAPPTTPGAPSGPLTTPFTPISNRWTPLGVPLVTTGPFTA
jgi:hypothetical protein